MWKKHQVFVCSTFKDLKEQRQDLFIELYRNGFIPMGMEGFVPGDQGQLDYIRERIDECDYFVIMVAHRFGTPSPGSSSGESITEFEYGYAMSKGSIPVSRFVIDEAAPWPGGDDYRSTGNFLRRLIDFKHRLERSSHDLYDTNPWNKENLVHKVLTSLNMMRQRTPRPGLIRPTELSTDAERFGVERLFAGLRKVNKEPLISGHRKLWIIMNDGYNFFDTYKAHLRRALESGASVRILLVHPESMCLEAIAEKSHKPPEQQEKDIKRSIQLLLGQFSSFPNFRLLGHKQFNTYFGLINENECLVDFYFNFRLDDRRQEDRIALQCSAEEHGDTIYQKVSDDFEAFWRYTEAREDSDLSAFK
jgi:hypothetical protein